MGTDHPLKFVKAPPRFLAFAGLHFPFKVQLHRLARIPWDRMDNR
jgi:hypothetical protein